MNDHFEAGWTVTGCLWLGGLFFVWAFGPPDAPVFYFCASLTLLAALVGGEVVRAWISALCARRRQRGRSRSSS